MLNLLRQTALLGTTLSLISLAVAQAPTPAAPTPAPMTALGAPALPIDPSAAAPDPAGQSLELVRQAIARQDYPAAQAALDSAKQANPNSPNIVLYQSLIQRGQAQGVIASPEPRVSPTAVEMTPVAVPAIGAPGNENAEDSSSSTDTTPTASSDSLVDKAKELWENETVRYGLIGAVALIVLLLIYSLFKKRRNRTEQEAFESERRSMPAGGLSLGAFDEPRDEEHLGAFDSYNSGDNLAGGELASASSSMDFSTPEYSSGSPSAGLGGSALSGSMEGYSVPTFDHDDEEEEHAPPPPRPAPAKPVDDDAMIDIFADDEPAPAQAPVTPVEPEPVSESVSFASLGLDSPPPKQPAFSHFSDEETVILSAPDAEPITPAASRNATPTSSPSLSSGTVDLEDIFGSQPLPGQDAGPGFSTKSTSDASFGSFSDSDEDSNSQTLPTFVAAPGANNPAQSNDSPPPARHRPVADTGSDTESISFEELFGAPDESSSTMPAPSVTEPPSPAPVTTAPASEDSVEDALAAALSAMAAESPDESPAQDMTEDDIPVQSSESLDDRTERMFNDQMGKARRAVAEKNWRQAVHVLSIASALHPENEEAKQMLKDARAEKRKSEESV